MENINIKNGIPINKTKAYCMYHMYFPDNSEFFMCIPSKAYDLYKVIVDINDIDFNIDDIDIDDIVSGKISSKTDSAYDEYPNCIYIIPKISIKELNDALTENDDRLYKRLLKKIEKHRNNAYWSLANAAIFEDAIHVESQINILKKSNDDVKLFWWMDINGIQGYKQIEIHERPKLSSENSKKLKEAQEELEKEKEEAELNKKAEQKLKAIEIEELNKKAEEKLKKINEIKEALRKAQEEEAQKTYKEITNVIVFEPPKDIPSQKTKKRTPKGDGVHSTGYSNIAFIITVLILSTIMGISLAYLILR